MSEKIIRVLKGTYKVNNKSVYTAQIIQSREDKGGKFYIYNMYDENGKIQTLNAYCHEENDIKRPFDKLTVAEEKILNPPVEVVLYE